MKCPDMPLDILGRDLLSYERFSKYNNFDILNFSLKFSILMVFKK